MPKLQWGSVEQESKEWEIAKLHLEGRSDGIKLRRSKEGPRQALYTDRDFKKHPLFHSFMNINGQTFALAGKGRILGQGSFGKVKLAEDEQSRLYVMKIGLVDDVDENELSILGDLNLLRGSGRRSGKQYVALDFLGKSLDKVDFKSDKERLEVSLKLVEEIRQLNAGVASKSSTKIYHNDIKPENVVLSEDGKVSLIDFGLSSDKTIVGGTLDFLAPEALSEEAKALLAKEKDMGSAEFMRELKGIYFVKDGYPASTQTDCYSLGLTLKEFVPTRARLHHTLGLMQADEPLMRPSLDVVKIVILAELHKDSDLDLYQALLESQYIADTVNEIKAISALLEGSTVTTNLATEQNLSLVKESPELSRSLALFYNLLGSDYFDQNTEDTGANKEQIREFIRELIACEDKTPNSIQAKMQEYTEWSVANLTTRVDGLAIASATPFFGRSQEEQQADLSQAQAANF
ncbi:serine/threonine-protein kinase 1 [Piscirickettsia salmonis]|uniref:Kinase domain protein n=1 Tax=Piscirickettsia salmonis TaxID=1238 RepID=A0A1L6TBW6_PISSA|nr:protein kinase [Piscirickettsia salmonis]AKP73981.1 kinase [Piscirickettsia salmonis LF-89 = ATCC VR-1361]ALB22818.1 kinase domain protein [Piscirickettsia salmonis]ALY02803.1 kinase [Piscirickettsia salmonis]AMA42358.1 kinase [Piscirickettsia salmonis]AOS34826.1 kinase [Piscirickettsia salmonis]